MGIIENKKSRHVDVETYDLSEDLGFTESGHSRRSNKAHTAIPKIHQNVTVHRIVGFEASEATFFIVPEMAQAKTQVSQEPRVAQPETAKGERQDAKITLVKNTPSQWIYLLLLGLLLALVLVFARMR